MNVPDFEFKTKFEISPDKKVSDLVKLLKKKI